MARQTCILEESIEDDLEQFIKTDLKLLDLLTRLKWGDIVIKVKNGKPVMLDVRRERKLD